MKKILLIEDDRALRENTEELLGLSDYSVITAPNGKLGIVAAKEHLPDMVVCDIMMPEIDGYGVLENLCSNESTRHIPFIFLSAKTEHKEIRKGMDLGADDYLTKPFEEEDLLSAIESRLAKAEILKRMTGTDIPCQDTATAMEDIELAGISKEDLKDILERNHNVSLELMELLTNDISEIKDQLLQMAYSSVRKKTARTLLQFAEIMATKAGDPIKISRNDLASVAGIATESLTRTLSGFKKEGLIAIEGRNIRIKEIEALQYVN